MFFTAVNPMNIHEHWQKEFDLTKPRIAVYRQKWKLYQNTVYWINLTVAQRKGLKFYLTRSNAIILYNTLPPCCMEKVVLWKTGEVLYDQVYKSPRSPPKITLKTAWTKRRVDTSNLEARESSADSSEHRETCSQKGVNDGSVNQHRETGSLSDNCLEQQDTTRKNIVKNLIHQIETHPHREALKADLQQNQEYNPFSEESKNTSRCAKSPPRSSALYVWRIARKGSCTADADSAWNGPI